MRTKEIRWYQPVEIRKEATRAERFAVWGRNFFTLPSENRYTTIALRILACAMIVPPLLALAGRITYYFLQEPEVIPEVSARRESIPFYPLPSDDPHAGMYPQTPGGSRRLCDPLDSEDERQFLEGSEYSDNYQETSSSSS